MATKSRTHVRDFQGKEVKEEKLAEHGGTCMPLVPALGGKGRQISVISQDWAI